MSYVQFAQRFRRDGGRTGTASLARSARMSLAYVVFALSLSFAAAVVLGLIP